MQTTERRSPDMFALSRRSLAVKSARAEIKRHIAEVDHFLHLVGGA